LLLLFASSAPSAVNSISTSLLSPWPAGEPPPDLLLIAGEASGDEHAARLVRSLKARHPTLRIAALGGPALKEAGAVLLFDLTAHAVVGLVEVLKNYGFFKSLFNETLAWIQRHQPRAVLLVDYPGFNLRLAEKLYQTGLSHRAGGKLKVLYYIGPQIWAWNAHRRFAMAKWLDALAVIFPFETACYADTPLPVEFVGHPFAAPGHQLPIAYAADGPILLLPGSRTAPVTRIFPAMLAGFAAFREIKPDAKAVVLYPTEKVRAIIAAQLAARSAGQQNAAQYITLKPVAEGAAGRSVLTSSGTMSLACALAGVPGAIVYRANPFTYLVGRAVVSIPYLGIANLLLGDSAWPEFIQGAARPDALAQRLLACENPAAREQAAASATRLRQLLGETPALAVGADSAEQKSPTVYAAAWLEKLLCPSGINPPSHA
jgi:lipid-A-disaccharide synthase